MQKNIKGGQHNHQTRMQSIIQMLVRSYKLIITACEIQLPSTFIIHVGGYKEKYNGLVSDNEKKTPGCLNLMSLFSAFTEKSCSFVINF